MIEPFDEETLMRFDNGQTTDHEIKAMMIAKIQEIIEYCNDVANMRTRIADKATELLSKLEKTTDKHTQAQKSNGEQT